ncbi:SidA/IucD/PvdA family monooxygenase, partial [bacterium]|nr:SidA/IucD/PvdA family monooxygenase [bacterium]
MSEKESIDVVIVGGGQAGISLSYYLQQQKIPHIILERERAFSAWHNRWDGFNANTPNWMNTLPVLSSNQFPANDPKGFATKEELVNYFEKCLQEVRPPIKTGVEVYKITQLNNGVWQISTQDTVYEAKNVAVCIGAMSTPKIPENATNISSTVPQIHSCEYRNPDQITTKSVLLVGSGSSGVQICRLLCSSGKFDKIHLAVSNILVLPKHILGIQTHKFLHFFGLFDIRNNSILGKLMYSNLETKGDPIMRPAPNDLSKLYGVHIYDRFTEAQGSLLHFADGQTLETDDLTIIWCTGFHGDYSFI